MSRIKIAIKKNAVNARGQLKFSIYTATTSNNPDVLLQETDWIAVGGWAEAGYVWFEIPFLQTDWTPATSGLCLTVTGATGLTADAFVKFDELNSSGSGSGASAAPIAVSSASTSDLIEGNVRMYVYGAYETNGEPQW